MPVGYRRCISCRRTAHRSEFWRVVRCHGDRRIQLDSGMGRSAYICPTEECLQIAQRKKRLERSLRSAIAPAIYDQLWQRLNREGAENQKRPNAEANRD
ncbi:MAG: YlxR family protein [Cyanobacteria bacterium P01_D01_bin.73]